MARNQPKMRVMKRDEQEYKRLRSNYRAKLWRLRRATDFTLPAHEIDSELGLYFPDIKEFRDGAFKTRKGLFISKSRFKECPVFLMTWIWQCGFLRAFLT